MEEQELERLVRKYAPSVKRLAYARMGNLPDAEDVTQEAFLRLVRSGKEFRDDEHCKAWLLRVALNCAGDLFRAPWRRHTTPLEDAAELTAEPVPEEDGMLEAVLALPAKYRAAIHLFYYEGLSTAEIAGLLGKSEGAVRTRLSRARDMLRANWKGDEDCV